MKVKELIKELKVLDQEKEIFVGLDNLLREEKLLNLNITRVNEVYSQDMKKVHRYMILVNQEQLINTLKDIYKQRNKL